MPLPITSSTSSRRRARPDVLARTHAALVTGPPRHRAALDGRIRVPTTKRAIVPVLAHRLRRRPARWSTEALADAVREVLQKTPVRPETSLTNPNAMPEPQVVGLTHRAGASDDARRSWLVPPP